MAKQHTSHAESLPPMAVPIPAAIPTAVPVVAVGGGQHDPTYAARKMLKTQGFPDGLADHIVKSLTDFPTRYWIVDNSGSMATYDGHAPVDGSPDKPARRCSRWEELRTTVRFHAQLADALQTPVEFRLLNRPYCYDASSRGQHPPAQVVVVGDGGHGGGGHGGGGQGQVPEQYGLGPLEAAMATDPTGGTPLCQHIRAVRNKIAERQHALRARGQRAVVVIATDGCSTDGDLRQAIRGFEGLPVWLIVRLCTDDDKVAKYWDNIDGELEVSVDVLDDLKGECTQVMKHNPWLNYDGNIHRAREWGMPHKLFDFLDERKLTGAEALSYCRIVLGGGGVARPDMDWPTFEADANLLLLDAPPSWNPVWKRALPAVSMYKLKRVFHDRANDASGGPAIGCAVLVLCFSLFAAYHGVPGGLPVFLAALCGCGCVAFLVPRQVGGSAWPGSKKALASHPAIPDLLRDVWTF